MSGMKRLTGPPKLWEILATATATILTIVIAAVSATWAYGRSISDTQLRISEVELKVSEVELRLSTAIKDGEIRTLEMLAEMRKDNRSAHDRIEALITDLRVDFAEFAASRPGARSGMLDGAW
ncbi:MAG: hypothetical protein OXK77_18850 [Gemmatimonadota bacterium]|nr:hypothetical protein [Gemmatimonadota bacterium]MDE2865658.1 hypothetical protein [Gemmatimonadota bacterium]